MEGQEEPPLPPPPPEQAPPPPPPPPPRRGGRRGSGGPGPGSVGEGSPRGPPACEGGAAVVQRTQVVLLSGEPWGLDGGQTVLSSFAHHVLPPGGSPSAPSPAPSPPALPPSPSGRLLFFLCRAASLRGPEGRLREVLRGLREQARGAPAVLVGVVVQPPPEEEEAALGHLEALLREAFPQEGGAPEVHTALFAPGRPEGALQLRPLAQGGPPAAAAPLAAAVSALWQDKALMMQILGALVSFGTMMYGSYYFYNNPPF